MKKNRILLNYTGKIVEIVKNGTVETSLPPIGNPKMETQYIDESEAEFNTIEVEVSGIPLKKKDIYIIVNEDVARALCGVRDDLLIVTEQQEAIGYDRMNFPHKKIIGKELRHYIVTTL